MKLIYFVRHGETDWNKTKRWQGGEIETELNPTGKLQAAKTGTYLDRYQQKEKAFDLVISSPMKRTKESAEIMCSKINYPINKILYDDKLKEKNYGTLTGKTNAEIKKDPNCKLYNSILENWVAIKDPIERMNKREQIDKELFDYYKIETTERLKERCKKVIDQVINSSFSKILIVTHGHIIKVFLKLLFHLNWEIPMGKLLGDGNCIIMLVSYDQGQFELMSCPNNEHLSFV